MPNGLLNWVKKRQEIFLKVLFHFVVFAIVLTCTQAEGITVYIMTYFIVTGSNSYGCTKCPQLFLVGTQHSPILVISQDTDKENVQKLNWC